MNGIDSKANSSVDVTDWSDGKVEALLDDWRRRVLAAQMAHYRSADVFRFLNYVLGVPAIAFSSMVGTAIFAGLEKDSPRTLVASASILAAVLAGLQTFLRFPERALEHAKAAEWYAAVRRDLEQILSLSVKDRGRAKECVDRVRKEMNQASQDAPELSSRRWERYAKRFAVKDFASPV